MNQPRRREVLGTIASVGAVVGTAGCLGALDADGGSNATTTAGTTEGSTDDASGTTDGSTAATTDGTTPTETTRETTAGSTGEFGGFAAWTPPQSAFETDRLTVGYTNAAAVREHADELAERTNTTLVAFVNRHARRVGLDAQSVDHDLLLSPSYEGEDVVRSARINVFAGGFAASDVTGSDALAGFEADGSHRGYDLYAGSESSAAVRDGVALRASNLRLTGVEYARAVIDARSGDGERFVDANADAGLAMGGMASVDFLQARTDPWAESTPPSHFEGNVALARAFSFEGSTTRLEWRFVFEAADQVDASAIRSDVEENQAGLSTYDYTVESDGRVAVVAGTTPTAEFDLLAEGTP